MVRTLCRTHLICEFWMGGYMADMTDERWNAIKTKIDLWFDNHEGWEDKNFELLSVPNLVVAGDKKPAKRTALYSAIRTCFSDIPDKPFTTGKKSAMPDEVQARRDGVLDILKKHLTESFTLSEEMQKFLVRNKRSGGGLFVDGEDYATSVCDAVRLRMNAAYNAHLRSDDKADYIWDGSEEGLVCQIPAKESEQ